MYTNYTFPTVPGGPFDSRGMSQGTSVGVLSWGRWRSGKKARNQKPRG